MTCPGFARTAGWGTGPPMEMLNKGGGMSLWDKMQSFTLRPGSVRGLPADPGGMPRSSYQASELWGRIGSPTSLESAGPVTCCTSLLALDTS